MRGAVGGVRRQPSVRSVLSPPQEEEQDTDHDRSSGSEFGQSGDVDAGAAGGVVATSAISAGPANGRIKGGRPAQVADSSCMHASFGSYGSDSFLGGREIRWTAPFQQGRNTASRSPLHSRALEMPAVVTKALLLLQTMALAISMDGAVHMASPIDRWANQTWV